MKKTLAFLLTLALLLPMFSSVALADEPYTYTVATYTTGPLGEETPVIDLMNEKYNVNFEMVYIENSVRGTQLNLLAASDELPDVFYGADNQMFYQQGLLGTFTEEYFREHCPRISAMIDEYAPNGWSVTKFDGEMYTIPCVRYVNTVPNPIAWNGAWLEKLGVTDMPKTLEEFESLLYRIAKEDPDGNGKDDTYGISATALQAVYGAFGMQRGMWLEDDNGNVVFGDVMPEAKDALAMLAKWYADGVLDPEFITGENQGGYWAIPHAFVNQRIAVSSSGQWYHWIDLTEQGIDYKTQIPTAITDTGKEFDVVFSQPPVGPTGKAGTIRQPAIQTRVAFKAELVEDTERFGRLLDIIDDMTMDPATSLVTYCGIEGEHWDYSEIGGKKCVVLKEGVTDTQLVEIGARNWFSFTNYSMEHQLIMNAQNAVFADLYLKDFADMYYEKAITVQLPSDTLYSTETNKILAEGYIAIITGEKPIDYFDEMVEQWNAAGGKILTEEANALYQNK